ncbi:hypothetical protein GQ54DRAFT_306513 [Martensiomyces pterosporus]|nr:hypothetical protein GQ54DRAFT_306513 [Martensiomyces pterosporus]
MEATPLATAAEIESETVEGVANGASTIDQAVNSFHKEHQNIFGFGTGADSGSGSAGTESSEDINADEGEDIGMTREIMGSDDTENLTASRVSFDQWMHDHAVLDGERSVEEAGEQDYGYDEYEYVDGLDQNESPGTDIQNAWLNAKSSWAVENGDNTEESAADPNKCGDAISIGSSDGDDASDTDCGDSTGYDEECYNEEMAGDSGGVDVDDYQPDTTAASACGKCTALPQNLQMGLQGFAQPVDAGQDVHMHQFATSALVGTCDSVGLSLDHSFTAMPLNASDQESVASAMRFLADIAGQSIIGGGEPGTLVGMQVSNSEYETALPLEAAEGMAEISDEKTSGKPAGAYKRPPLPLENTAQSLGDMHKAISECIGRSIAIADEISAGCDDAEAKTAVMEHQQPPITESTAGNDAEGTSGELYDDVMALEEDSRESIELANETLCAFEKFCTESIAERDKLNSQIVVLNTEIYRLDTEKLTLKHRIKELEAECTEHSQKTDELECGLKSITEANSKEIEDLKARVRAVASKASSLSGELDSTKHKLEETQQVLAVVSCERTDLIGKCNGLESDLESFTGRLKSEQLAHEETKRALHVARDGNASEARRAELQSLTVKLEQKCTELSKRLARSQDHERLLLNSTRALEARLSDALRRLDEPQRPEDILEDHRREWDAQLVESRKQARNAHEKLVVAEEKLDEERRTNAILRRRIEEMESVYARPGEAARKRKRDTSSTVGPDGSQATASADDCGESFAGALDTTPVSLSGCW